MKSDQRYDDESERMLEQYQRTRSHEAATTLILKYESLVRTAATKISRNRHDLYEDLYQVGQMSLLRLFEQYDASLGVRFEAYAMKSLIGHMKNYLRDKSWYIQVPRRIKEKSQLVQKVINELTMRLERSPGVHEIADFLELSLEETTEILAGREYYHYVSLDTPLSAEENASSVGEMISAAEDQYKQADDRMDLQEAFACLKEEEKKVLTLVYSKGESQRNIARMLGISQMSVSRIQKKAVEKLRKSMLSQ